MASLKVLDIGAGFDYARKDNPYIKLPKEQGGVQLAQIRWLHHNTVSRMRRILGNSRMSVHGVDLVAPEDFSNDELEIEFHGYSIGAVPDEKFRVMTWFYPNPWDIYANHGNERMVEHNPLDFVLFCVQHHLENGGLLVFETDMCLPDVSDLDAIGQVELAAVRSELEQVLVDTQVSISTNEPSRGFGTIYKKQLARMQY